MPAHLAMPRTALDDEVLAFLRERHLATLTTLRADGSPHVVPVGFGYDADERIVRVITNAPPRRRSTLADGGRAAVCQVDGAPLADARGRSRSCAPTPSGATAAVAGLHSALPGTERAPERVAIVIDVDRIIGSV